MHIGTGTALHPIDGQWQWSLPFHINKDIVEPWERTLQGFALSHSSTQ